jgi:hypothetical protein
VGHTNQSFRILPSKYGETSIHRFRWGSEKETMDMGAYIKLIKNYQICLYVFTIKKRT